MSPSGSETTDVPSRLGLPPDLKEKASVRRGSPLLDSAASSPSPGGGGAGHLQVAGASSSSWGRPPGGVRRSAPAIPNPCSLSLQRRQGPPSRLTSTAGEREAAAWSRSWVRWGSAVSDRRGAAAARRRSGALSEARAPGEAERGPGGAAEEHFRLEDPESRREGVRGGRVWVPPVGAF
ncbi:unnamed protein product [Urochloa humidicola]